MKFVFIIGAAHAFFLAAIAMAKKHKSKGDYVMMVLLALMGLLLTGYAFEVMEIDTDYPIFLGFYTAMPTLFGPLVYLYVVSYTKKSQKFNFWFLLHALPYVVFTIAVFLQLLVYSEGSVVEDKEIIEGNKKTIFYIMAFFRVFVGAFYLTAAFIELRKHAKRIGHQFSYTDQIDLKWLKFVILTMLVLWSTIIATNILYHLDVWLPYRIGDNIIFSVITLIVFLTGYYGIKQQIIYAPQPIPQEKRLSENVQYDKAAPAKQYEHSGLTQTQSEDYLQRLQNYMEEEQPYLDGKLSLRDVAEHLGISTNHLSQVINENLNINFFDFVNSYRVAMMKKKMRDPANGHLTFLGMAYDSGFNSKSSFNNTFKKMTGLTPSEYLKSEAGYS